MKTYTTLAEMENDGVVHTFASPVLKFMRAISVPGNLSGNFELDFGGDVYLVETLEDLDSIYTLVEDPVDDSRWLNIREAASTFDQAAYLHGREWAMLWMATNNNGGSSYFIPRTIVDQCPHIEESMRLSSETGEVEELSEAGQYVNF